MPLAPGKTPYTFKRDMPGRQPRQKW